MCRGSVEGGARVGGARGRQRCAELFCGGGGMTCCAALPGHLPLPAVADPAFRLPTAPLPPCPPPPQFIAGFANMRARNYAIPEVDKLQVRVKRYAVRGVRWGARGQGAVGGSGRTLISLPPAPRPAGQADCRAHHPRHCHHHRHGHRCAAPLPAPLTPPASRLLPACPTCSALLADLVACAIPPARLPTRPRCTARPALPTPHRPGVPGAVQGGAGQGGGGVPQHLCQPGAAALRHGGAHPAQGKPLAAGGAGQRMGAGAGSQSMPATPVIAG